MTQAHTIFFPLGTLTQAFINTYLSRYTDPVTGWAAAHWDDVAHTRLRRASLFDGSIDPVPHYNAKVPAEPTSDWLASHLDGHTIEAIWPESFLDDLARDPQPEPELFGGIVILT